MFHLKHAFRGERGIRTPGPVTVNSFQDCRIRPLCHFSNMCFHYLIASANIRTFFGYANLFLEKKHLFLRLFFKCFILYTLEGTYFSKKLKNKFNTLRIRLFLTHIQSFLPFLFPRYSIPILFLRYQYHVIFGHRFQNLYCQ